MALVHAYGRFRLTQEQWRELLRSNQGLFRRRATPLASVIGPRMNATGDDVVGHMLTQEFLAFQDFADTSQRDFYRELQSTNREAAVEYVLVIGGSIDVWQEDIKSLRTLLELLEEEDLMLKTEEDIFAQEEPKLLQAERFHQALKRQLPRVFADISLEHDVHKTIVTVRNLRERIGPARTTIRRFLHDVAVEYPFLLN